MNFTHFIQSFWGAFIAASLGVLLLMLSYFVMEPVVSRAQTSETFIVTQTITSEISFVASTSVNNLNPNINGLSGGYATGSAQVAVQTNSATGWTMDVRFGTSTAHTGDKMRGNSNGGVINDYSLATATSAPDFQWVDNGAGGASEFGFTVNASNTLYIADTFRHNDTNCNQPGGSYTFNRCWMTPTSTNYRIMDSDEPTPSGSGATSTVIFKVAVPNNPNPALPNDTYTATVTLTAATQ